MRLAACQPDVARPEWQGFDQQLIQQIDGKIRPVLREAAQAVLAFQVTAQGGDDGNVFQHFRCAH